MLMLMDKVLQEQGLDLQLTSFRVLSTGPGQGLVERVPDCMPLAQILAEHRGDIRRYLELAHPAPDGADARYRIDPTVLETFVKSCAGYCVAMCAARGGRSQEQPKGGLLRSTPTSPLSPSPSHPLSLSQVPARRGRSPPRQPDASRQRRSLPH